MNSGAHTDCQCREAAHGEASEDDGRTVCNSPHLSKSLILREAITSSTFASSKRCMRKMGILGVSEEDLRKLFNKYDTDGSGAINLSEFASGVMKSFASQNSVNMKKGNLEKMMVARKVAESRRQKAMSRYMSNTLRVDVEKVLLEKIEQKMEGGPGGLRRAFRKV